MYKRVGIRRFFAAIGAAGLIAGALAQAVPASANGANIISNPGFETANGNKPAGWLTNSWGTNTASFAYTTSGHSGGRAASVTVSGYKSGDAKWYFTPVAVTPGVTYTFSNWYKSSVVSGLDAVVTTTAGTTSYIWLGNPAASAGWKQQTFSFTAPANAKTVTFYHYLQKNGTLAVDDYSLTANIVNEAPTVNVTAPAHNATVNGTVALSASAADDKGVSKVQFQIDGANFGAAITAAPYDLSWDTTGTANGAHVVTAVATDADGASTTSAAVNITVSNTTTNPTDPTPPTGNLIANPSVENAAGSSPEGWTGNGWGANTRSFTHETNGQEGSRSVRATISSYTDGDAKWYFTPVAVTPGATYAYSAWYKSDVTTEVDAMVTMKDGSAQYMWLGSAPASAGGWQKVNMQFVVPADAATVTVFHAIAAVGYVQTDNFSLTHYVPGQFNRGLVTLTFDDGWRNIRTNGLPLLQKHGLLSTQYINSTPIIGAYPDYMDYQMVQDFAAAGHELGWHTRDHANITTATAAQLDTELTIPTELLSGISKTAADFKHFASPYGAYNEPSVSAVLQKYQSHRSTDVGFNTRDNFTVTNVKVQNITSTTTPADVQAWVNEAISNKSWLVIVYHEVSDTPHDPTYAVTPANLDAELGLIKQSGVTVKTFDTALAEIQSQL